MQILSLKYAQRQAELKKATHAGTFVVTTIQINDGSVSDCPDVAYEVIPFSEWQNEHQQGMGRPSVYIAWHTE